MPFSGGFLVFRLPHPIQQPETHPRYFPRLPVAQRSAHSNAIKPSSTAARCFHLAGSIASFKPSACRTASPAASASCQTTPDLVLTFLAAAAAIGVFVAGGDGPNVENVSSVRGHASGVSRVDLADEAVEYCAFFVAVYLWRTLILTSAKIFVAVISPRESVREEAPDLIIFGALWVGILGCGWINKALIPKVHVLRLGLEGMECRKWRLALLEAELKRTSELDCGVGKHVVPLAGEHPHCVWIIRWLPVVRVLLSLFFLGMLIWVSSGDFKDQDEEKAVWIAAKAVVAFVVVSEFVAVLVDKSRHIERCLKCFVEGSRAPSWGLLAFGNGVRLTAIIFGEGYSRPSSGVL